MKRPFEQSLAARLMVMQMNRPDYMRDSADRSLGARRGSTPSKSTKSQVARSSRKSVRFNCACIDSRPAMPTAVVIARIDLLDWSGRGAPRAIVSSARECAHPRRPR